MTADTSTVFHVVLEGRTVGPYDRRTIVGMRIKKALTNDHVLIGDNGDQLTVGELIARRSRPSSGFAMSRNPHSTHLLPSYPVRFLKGGFGFRGEGEARLQPDILRIEGDRRSLGFLRKRARVKVPLNCIREAAVEGATVSFLLAPEAPFGAAVLRSRVALALDSPDSARELFSFLPEAAAGAPHVTSAPAPAATLAAAPPQTAPQPAAVPARPRRPAPAAPGLAALNLAAFAAVAALGGDALIAEASTLVRAGANFGPLTRDGQAWRLVTSLFLSPGLVPLLVSLLGLLTLGRAAERAMGTMYFLAVYFTAGIFGGLVTLWWQPWAQGGGATVPLVGAACAFAVFAALPGNRVGRGALMSQWPALAVLVAWWAGYGQAVPGMDHTGHAAAALMGVLAGFAVSRPTAWWPGSWRFVSVVAVAVFAAGAGITLWMQTPNRGAAWRADTAFLRGLDKRLEEQRVREAQSGVLRAEERSGSRDRAARDRLALSLRENQGFWRLTEEQLRSERLPVDARTARAHSAMVSHAAGQQELLVLSLEGVMYGETAELDRRKDLSRRQAAQAAQRLAQELAAIGPLKRQGG
ncbi:MAG: rhomboid family intramembrane serine protease [Burkholderiaceae bacterium]